MVQNIPGVTRDRLHAVVELGRLAEEYRGVKLEIIDTGGLFFEEDELQLGVQKQAEKAIAEADLIIFAVDGRAGLTEVDHRIKKYLLSQTDKRIILLINKIDSPELEYLAAEFYALGIERVLCFSCVGRNFRRSMRKLLPLIIPGANLQNVEVVENNVEVDAESAAQEKKIQQEIPKFVLMGRPNTGKSSLLNKILGQDRALVHQEAGTTRDALDTEMSYEGRRITLIDTAGLRRKSKVQEELERFSVDRTIKGLVRSDVALLVLDCTAGISQQDKRLAALIKKRNKGCVIVLNKWDLLTDRDHGLYTSLLRRELNFLHYAPIVITSALTGQRTQKILQEALRVHANIHRQIKTSTLNMALRESMALRGTSPRFKIYYVVQTSIAPPTFTLFVNHPKKATPADLLYVEKSLRQEFDFEGAVLNFLLRNE